MSEAKNRKLAYKAELKDLLEKLDKCESILKLLPPVPRTVDKDLYFNDGIRKIDFMLVYSYKSDEVAKAKVNRYIRYLEKEGLEFEGYNSKVNPHQLFIKVHGQTEMLIKRASVFDITLAYINENRVLRSNKHGFLDFMHTELSRPDPNSRVYKRAPESVSGMKPTTITSAERIMLVYDLLKHTKYGPRSHEFGVKSLVKEKSLLAAYPLHDGGYNWTEFGPLSDRQLLARFWAKQKYFYKYQPLDLINKYYGPEVAFYFAFYGFYNKMLVYASIMGLMSILFGLITFSTPINHVSKSICNSKEYMCPNCYYPEICDYQEIKSYCTISKLSYIIDNTGTFCYAIAMCFWATIFSELWKRKQKTLMFKWNLLMVEEDFTLRNEFIAKARSWRKSKYEDLMVPYERFWRKILKFMTTSIVIQFFIIIMLAVIYGTILLRLIFRYWIIKSSDDTNILFNHVGIISNGIVNAMIVAVMICSEQFYQILAKFLTDFENPRTQKEYDKLYIYKQYTLFFLNAYGPLYYTSFFKGLLYQYPGDSEQYEGLRIVNADLCGPAGCIMQLSVQLIMTIVAKIMVKFCFSHVLLYALRYITKKKNHSHRVNFVSFPFFESSMSEHKCDYYFLLKDYLIQYGYIVLFTAAFPLTPLLALFCNLIDVRIDAYKLTKFYRRAVPVRACGIGAWNSVLDTLTYIGIVTNAFLIAFSTHFIPDMIHRLSPDYYNDEFVRFSFSNFSVNDYDSKFPKAMKDKMLGKYCLYLGQRYPPDHKLKYHYSKDYWYELSIRFISVLVLEVLVMCFTALLAFAIADVPAPIKEYLQAKQKAEQETKQNALIEAFRKSNE